MPYKEPSDEQFILCFILGRKLQFSIAGPPVAKPRPAPGKHGFRYNPAARKEKQFKKVLNQTFQSHLKCMPNFSKNQCLEISIEFLFPIPASANNPAKFRSSLFSKGDIDNFIKFTLDALSCDGCPVYGDDRQIIRVEAQKLGHIGISEGLTTVTITAME